jgi:hypothetical protein
MLCRLVIVAGCGPAEGVVVGFWPTKRRAVPSAPGVGLDTSPRFGCCMATKVAIRELAANAAASNFPLRVVAVLQPVVSVWELVDFVGRHTAPTCLLFDQN